MIVMRFCDLNSINHDSELIYNTQEKFLYFVNFSNSFIEFSANCLFPPISHKVFSQLFLTDGGALGKESRSYYPSWPDYMFLDPIVSSSFFMADSRGHKFNAKKFGSQAFLYLVSYKLRTFVSTEDLPKDAGVLPRDGRDGFDFVFFLIRNFCRYGILEKIINDEYNYILEIDSSNPIGEFSGEVNNFYRDSPLAGFLPPLIQRALYAQLFWDYLFLRDASGAYRYFNEISFLLYRHLTLCHQDGAKIIQTPFSTMLGAISEASAEHASLEAQPLGIESSAAKESQMDIFSEYHFTDLSPLTASQSFISLFSSKSPSVSSIDDYDDD